MLKITKGSLGLSIPVHDKASAYASIRLTSKDIERWRTDLPLADTGISAKKVYQLLMEMNQTDIPPKERFTMLELVREPTSMICQNLKKHYLHQIHALNPQKIAVVQLADTLQTQLSYGYKSIIEDIYSKQQGQDSKPLLSVAIHRSLCAYNQILLRCYQLYSTPPVGAWAEIHQLYLYAEKQGLLDQPELHGVYEQLVMMAGIDPYRFRQTEQENLNSAIPAWLPFTRLQQASQLQSQVQDSTTLPNLIFIDPKSDKAPSLLARKEISDIQAESLILNLEKVLERIQDLLHGVEIKEATGKFPSQFRHNEFEMALPSRVLKNLIRTLSIPLTRQKPRSNRNEPVRVCLGLSATHYYVSGGKPFYTGVDTQTNDKEAQKVDEESIDLSMIPLPDEKQFTRLSEFKTTPCHIVDDGEGGRCLLWEQEPYPPLQAGDVLGIQPTAIPDAPWQTGTVRWLKHDRDKKLRIGVQLFPDAVEAAGIQLLKEGQAQGHYLRCLIVKNCVITAPIPFKVGSRVMIRRIEGDSMTLLEADLNKLLEESGSQRQFQFVDKAARIKTTLSPQEQEKVAPNMPAIPAPAPDKPPEAGSTDNKKSGSKEDPFDSLWNQL